MAACPMAWARGLLPVPGGPRKRASSWRPTKLAVARSKTRLRFILGLKVKSKLSRVLCGSRNSACLRRRSSKRSLRRASSSATRQEMRSMGGMASAWACRKRVSSTAAIPPSRSCRKARSNSIMFMFSLRSGLGVFFLVLQALGNQVAILLQFANERIDLPQVERELGTVLQVSLDEAVVGRAHLQRHNTSLVDRGSTVLFG